MSNLFYALKRSTYEQARTNNRVKKLQVYQHNSTRTLLAGYLFINFSMSLFGTLMDCNGQYHHDDRVFYTSDVKCTCDLGKFVLME